MPSPAVSQLSEAGCGAGHDPSRTPVSNSGLAFSPVSLTDMLRCSPFLSPRCKGLLVISSSGLAIDFASSILPSPFTRGGVLAIALSPDGDFCYSGGEDGSIRVWRVPEEGRDVEELYETAQENVLAGHQGPVVAIACLSEHTLVSAGRDGTCRVWDTVDGSCSAMWRAPGEPEPEEDAQPNVRPTCVAVSLGGAHASRGRRTRATLRACCSLGNWRKDLSVYLLLLLLCP